MRPLLLIPAGTFHVARPADSGEWALLGTTSRPDMTDGEFERGDVAVPQQRHPESAGQRTAVATA